MDSRRILLLAAFVISLFGLTRFLNDRYDVLILDERSESAKYRLKRIEGNKVFAYFPAEYIDVSIPNAIAAKSKRRLWTEVSEFGLSAALGMLENPETIDEFLPGFPSKLKTDSTLWQTYFQQEFDFDLYLPSIQKLSPFTHRTLLSSSGCVLIFQKYGADVVVLGNSETNRAILPTVLSTNLKVYGKPPSTLMCTQHGADIANFANMARALANTKRKSKATILGVSLWHLIQIPLSASTQSKMDQIKTDPSWMHVSLAQLLPAPKWEDWLRFSWQAFKEKTHEKNRWLNSNLIEKPMPETAIFDANGKGYIPFAKALFHEETELEKLMGTAVPYYPLLKGMTEKDCDTSLLEERLHALTTQLLQSTEHLFVFLNTTTPIQTRYAPGCALGAIQKALKKVANRRVSIRTDDWRGYQLGWSDFAVQTPVPNRMVIDVNHTNFGGANKVTNHIVKWMQVEIPGGGT